MGCWGKRGVIAYSKIFGSSHGEKRHNEVTKMSGKISGSCRTRANKGLSWDTLCMKSLSAIQVEMSITLLDTQVWSSEDYRELEWWIRESSHTGSTQNRGVSSNTEEMNVERGVMLPLGWTVFESLSDITIFFLICDYKYISKHTNQNIV